MYGKLLVTQAINFFVSAEILYILVVSSKIMFFIVIVLLSAPFVLDIMEFNRAFWTGRT